MRVIVAVLGRIRRRTHRWRTGKAMAKHRWLLWRPLLPPTPSASLRATCVPQQRRRVQRRRVQRRHHSSTATRTTCRTCRRFPHTCLRLTAIHRSLRHLLPRPTNLPPLLLLLLLPPLPPPHSTTTTATATAAATTTAAAAAEGCSPRTRCWPRAAK